MDKKYALIPAYEPDGRLLEIIEDAVAEGFQVIVVDDGSSDDCQQYFKQAEYMATVLHHPENKGKGAALKTGFARIALMCGADDVVVTLDADGQHTIQDVLKVCAKACMHPDSLILGSRALTENVPLRSKFGNTVTRFVYRLASGVRVHDTQTGLRACSCRLLSWMLEVKGDRYEYEMNVLLECPKADIPIREVPIKTIYLDDNKSSHFDTVKDSIRIYKEILKFSASSLACFVIDYLLYSVMVLLTAGIGAEVSLVISNVFARLVSATVNYNINRSYVFGADKETDKEGNLIKAGTKTGRRRFITHPALQYALLAISILIGNTLVLSLLVEIFGVNRLVAKLITELFFFVVSYLVQRNGIFKRARKGAWSDVY